MKSQPEHQDSIPIIERGRPWMVVQLVLAAVGLLLAWELASVLAITFVAMLLAIFLARGAALARRWLRVPDQFALFVFLLILLAVIALLIVTQGQRVADQLATLWQQFPAGIAKFRATVDRHTWMQRVSQQIPTTQGVNEELSGYIARVGGAVFNTLGVLISLPLVLALALYLALDSRHAIDGVAALLPADKRPTAASIIREIGQAMGAWLEAQLMAMTIIGLLIGIGLWLLGVPVPFACALIAALLTFIPNFGPIIATIPPALLAFTVSPTLPLAVIALHVSVQCGESYLITPLIQRSRAHIPPALLLVVQMAFGVMLGALGLAIAAPFLAAALVLYKHWRARMDGTQSTELVENRQ